jgi:hypothetical protein
LLATIINIAFVFLKYMKMGIQALTKHATSAWRPLGTLTTLEM